MMQALDTDIDLDLDDRQPELVYETTGWNHLVHGSVTALIVPSLVAVFAELTNRDGMLHAALTVAVLLFALAAGALVMEYRADHR